MSFSRLICRLRILRFSRWTNSSSSLKSVAADLDCRARRPRLTSSDRLQLRRRSNFDGTRRTRTSGSRRLTGRASSPCSYIRRIDDSVALGLMQDCVRRNIANAYDAPRDQARALQHSQSPVDCRHGAVIAPTWTAEPDVAGQYCSLGRGSLSWNRAASADVLATRPAPCG
jgi:hypothetical protein